MSTGETRVSARLVRLLNMVPYFIANPGISAAEAATELGVSERELMRDLNQLWVCGLPGYGPGDLIDLSFSEASIEVTFSAGIDRPLRLTSTEATALLVALRALTGQPGMVDPAAAQRAIHKIEQAAVAATGDGAATALELDGGEAPGKVAVEAAGEAADGAQGTIAATVRRAVRDGKALELAYYSASRDAQSERVVDPVRIVLFDGHSYLQAWCRLAQDVRVFRFDRIDAATVLDEAARPPKSARREVPPGLLGDDENLPVAVLEIDDEAMWVVDYYPIDLRPAPAAGGPVVGEMRFASYDWMVRLLLGFGGAIRVLEPAELAVQVRDRARAALAAYGAAQLQQG